MGGKAKASGKFGVSASAGSTHAIRRQDPLQDEPGPIAGWRADDAHSSRGLPGLKMRQPWGWTQGGPYFKVKRNDERVMARRALHRHSTRESAGRQAYPAPWLAYSLLNELGELHT